MDRTMKALKLYIYTQVYLYEECKNLLVLVGLLMLYKKTSHKTMM